MESLVLTGAVVVGALALGWLAGWWAERLRLKRAKASAEHEAARIREAAGLLFPQEMLPIDPTISREHATTSPPSRGSVNANRPSSAVCA